MQTLTFVVQILILAAVGWTSWSIWWSTKRIKQSHAMIEQYRREIGWLTERVEMLEVRTPGVVKFKA